MQKEAGEGQDSLGATILRALNYPYKAAGTPNLLLIIAVIVTGTLLFMGYQARQFIVYIISPCLVSVRRGGHYSLFLQCYQGPESKIRAFTCKSWS